MTTHNTDKQDELDHNKDSETNKHKFMIESEVLDALRDKMEDAAEIVHKTIDAGRPIIVRHHGDCDGYCGGVPVAMVITSIESKKGRQPWKHIKRMASRTPFYDYMDAVKDLTTHYKFVEAGEKPLMIIIDSGSSEQDVLAMSKIKQHGFSLIVIDHHVPFMKSGKSVIGKIADVLINPHLAGGDSNITGGMLGSEFAMMLVGSKWHGKDFSHLPAVSGIGDRSNCPENKAYQKLAEEKGYNIEMLKELAITVDFDAYFIGYMESGLVEDLLFEKGEKLKDKLKLIIDEIKAREKRTNAAFSRFAKEEKIGKYKLVTIDLKELLDQGKYPPQGKAVGMFKDSLKDDAVIVAGLMDGSMTIRTDIRTFDLPLMIDKMKEKYDYAQIEGGGHKAAGTIHFIDSARPEIIAYLKEYIKSL